MSGAGWEKAVKLGITSYSRCKLSSAPDARPPPACRVILQHLLMSF